MGRVGPSEITMCWCSGTTLLEFRGRIVGVKGGTSMDGSEGRCRIEGASGPGLNSFRPPMAATMAGVATIATKATAKIRSCMESTTSEKEPQAPAPTVSDPEQRFIYSTSMEHATTSKYPIFWLLVTNVPKLLYQFGYGAGYMRGTVPNWERRDLDSLFQIDP